ncbi:MAG: DUF167 domain-containing protein [Chloroflexi bacterium]|nr:DUF167 domain-containing protein [Chloroflexota bacterium]
MVYLQVRVQPGARRDEIIALQGDELRVRVSAPPVEGKANAAVEALLAAALGLRRGQVTVVRGAASRHKRIAIAGIGAKEVWARLARAMSA